MLPRFFSQRLKVVRTELSQSQTSLHTWTRMKVRTHSTYAISSLVSHLLTSHLSWQDCGHSLENTTSTDFFTRKPPSYPLRKALFVSTYRWQWCSRYSLLSRHFDRTPPNVNRSRALSFALLWTFCSVLVFFITPKWLISLIVTWHNSGFGVQFRYTSNKRVDKLLFVDLTFSFCVPTEMNSLSPLCVPTEMNSLSPLCVPTEMNSLSPLYTVHIVGWRAVFFTGLLVQRAVQCASRLALKLSSYESQLLIYFRTFITRILIKI
jgi:hypothetical protein